jgi:hypothetical protein
MKCSICKGKIEEHKTPEGEVYWTHGHNAEPLSNGRCCDKCNELVIQERINRVRFSKGTSLREILN